jgi:hypothetical protein
MAGYQGCPVIRRAVNGTPLYKDLELVSGQPSLANRVPHCLPVPRYPTGKYPLLCRQYQKARPFN